MKAETKRRINAAIERMDAALWIIVRRVALRWARKLVDAADERVQAAHVKLRNEIAERQASSQQGSPAVEPLRLAAGEDFQGIQNDAIAPEHMEGPDITAMRAKDSAGRLRSVPRSEMFTQWEARRSGVAPVTKKSARRRHRLTAADFDRQFA